MFKNKGLYIIIFVLLALISYQTYKIKKIRSENEGSEAIVTQSINAQAERDSVLDYKNMHLNIENESKPLNNALVYWGNDTLKTFPISALAKKGPVLVFRFSGLFCDKCIEEWISSIKKNFPDLANNSQIVLLGTEITPRMKENYFGKKMLSYASLTETVGLPMEKMSSPFFYILDNDKICKLFFVPDTAKPSLTDEYLRLIKHRFFL